jgi:hypothetical protein
MDDPALHVTEADLAALDERELLRRATLLRRGARMLLVAAAVLAATWVWEQVRFQMSIRDDLFGGFDPNSTESIDVSWLDRLDYLLRYAGGLGVPALVAGVGAWMHFAADTAIVRFGGHVTPWRAGDRIDGEEPVELDPA